MSDTEPIEVTVHIAARPETVFPYFTDPERYSQWMGASAVLRPEPGGAYQVTIRDGTVAAGEFLEIEPPRRIAFTWGWNHDPAVAPGSTRVVVTLEPEEGGTRVVLRHYGLPTDERVGHHRKGWTLYLDRLAIVVSGGEPGHDPMA